MSWKLEEKNGIIKSYHVKYIRKDDSSDTKTLATKEIEQQFKDLKAGKTYEFQVGGEYTIWLARNGYILQSKICLYSYF